MQVKAAAQSTLEKECLGGRAEVGEVGDAHHPPLLHPSLRLHTVVRAEYWLGNLHLDHSWLLLLLLLILRGPLVLHVFSVGVGGGRGLVGVEGLSVTRTDMICLLRAAHCLTCIGFLFIKAGPGGGGALWEPGWPGTASTAGRQL